MVYYWTLNSKETRHNQASMTNHTSYHGSTMTIWNQACILDPTFTKKTLRVKYAIRTWCWKYWDRSKQIFIKKFNLQLFGWVIQSLFCYIFRSVTAFAISITNGSFAWGRGKYDVPTLEGYEVNVCMVKGFVASSWEIELVVCTSQLKHHRWHYYTRIGTHSHADVLTRNHASIPWDNSEPISLISNEETVELAYCICGQLDASIKYSILYYHAKPV